MKIRLNTVKGKVLAGVAAVTLVSGAGFVAASTDAGTALENWYKGAFGQVETQVTGEVTKYGKDKLPGLYNEYQGIKTNAAEGINVSKITEVNQRTTNIKDAKDSHIEDVNDKEAEIMAYMASEFDATSDTLKTVLNQLGLEAKNYAYSDLKKFTEDKGSDALDQLTDELEAEKNAAVTELQNEIAASKTVLLAELNAEKESTVEELKAAIDNKINVLRNSIKAKADELVLIQVTLITDEGQKLENEAMVALDNVVADINN